MLLVEEVLLRFMKMHEVIASQSNATMFSKLPYSE